MAATLDHADYDLNVYDSGTGESLSPVKAVDVSEELPSLGQPVVLLYAEASHGQIVDILICRPGEKMGTRCMFGLDGLDDAGEAFVHRAKVMGTDGPTLLALLREHAPATGPSPVA